MYNHNGGQKKSTLGWGESLEDGTELWDDRPVFFGTHVTVREWVKLLFYPKKWVLYRFVRRAVREAKREHHLHTPIRVVDVGCGTGASVIDLKKLFGRSVEVIGVDVIELQIDIAKRRLKEYGVWSDVYWYDGEHLPFSDNSVDVIYTSDVLGHVKDVPRWLAELYRVLKPGGALAMFAESALGNQAYVRRYLLQHGVNVDPHATFHISLYAKKDLQSLLTDSGFVIQRMFSASWARVLTNPEEYYAALKQQKNFFFLRHLTRFLAYLKKKTHPFSTAGAELYSLVEMVTLGRIVESQGYVILAKKQIEKVFDEETEKTRGYTRLAVDFSPGP